MIFWPLFGVALGVLTVGIVRCLRRAIRLRALAGLLVFAASLYVMFGSFHALESAGLVIFSLFAAVGLRRPGVLALGWLLHAGWDGALHLALDQPTVGVWLPLFCLPYDVIVGAYLTHGLCDPEEASPGV